MSRFKDALQAQEGASNPIAVANALVAAIREVDGDTNAVCSDPACRLLAHQLAHLFYLREFDIDITPYQEALEHCQDKAGE